MRRDGISINRKTLILLAANKDGGAHVDATGDSRYEKLRLGAGWKLTLNTATGPVDVLFEHAHLAALRQLGYEVLHSEEILALVQTQIT